MLTMSIRLLWNRVTRHRVWCWSPLFLDELLAASLHVQRDRESRRPGKCTAHRRRVRERARATSLERRSSGHAGVAAVPKADDQVGDSNIGRNDRVRGTDDRRAPRVPEDGLCLARRLRCRRSRRVDERVSPRCR